MIVHRHLIDGDVVLMNRQPSLHKESIRGHRIRVMNGHSFRLNLATTSAYNADFDGDEMNMFVPQSLSSRAEIEELMSVSKTIIPTKFSHPVVGFVQDTLMTMQIILRKDSFITKGQLFDLFMSADIPCDAVPPPTIFIRNTPLWTMMDVFSSLFPPDLCCGSSCALDNNPWSNENDSLSTTKHPWLIQNGQWIYGSNAYDAFSCVAGGIVHVLYLDYGSKVCSDFLSKGQRLCNRFMLNHSYSIGIKDCIRPSIFSDTSIIPIVFDKWTRLHASILNTMNGTEQRAIFKILVLCRKIKWSSYTSRQIPLKWQQCMSDPISHITPLCLKIRKITKTSNPKKCLTWLCDTFDDCSSVEETDIFVPDEKIEDTCESILRNGVQRIRAQEEMERDSCPTWTNRISRAIARRHQQDADVQATRMVGDIQSVINDTIIGSLDHNNSIYEMVCARSKGNIVNIGQIMGIVGQQHVLGKRIKRTMDHKKRSLPHFTRSDMQPKAQGFVGQSYIQGLKPAEFFAHAQGGREGLTDTAIKTAYTGYMQRRLMKLLEGCTAYPDGSVRRGFISCESDRSSSAQNIIQFTYGGNSFSIESLEKNIVHTYSLPTNAFERYYKWKSCSDRILLQEWNHVCEIRQNIQAGGWKRIQTKRKSTGLVIMAPLSIQRILQTYLPSGYALSPSATRQTRIRYATWFQNFLKQVYSILRIFPNTEAQNDVYTMLCALLYEAFSSHQLSRYGPISNDILLEIQKCILLKIESAFVPYGTMIGCQTAESIGEPATQMTLNTFHYAGVSNRMMLGLPRLIEIINCSKKIKTPIMSLVLGPAKDQDVSHAMMLAKSFVFISLDTITETVSFHTSILSQDSKMVERSLIALSSEQRGSLSENIIRIVLNRMSTVDNGLTIDTITQLIQNHMGNRALVYSSEPYDKEWIIHIRFSNHYTNISLPTTTQDQYCDIYEFDDFPPDSVAEYMDSTTCMLFSDILRDRIYCGEEDDGDIYKVTYVLDASSFSSAYDFWYMIRKTLHRLLQSGCPDSIAPKMFSSIWYDVVVDPVWRKFDSYSSSDTDRDGSAKEVDKTCSFHLFLHSNCLRHKRVNTTSECAMFTSSGTYKIEVPEKSLLSLFWKDISQIGLSGIKDIKDASVRTINQPCVNERGEEIWESMTVVELEGSSLTKMMALPYINFVKVDTNDIVEVAEILGIEAARESLRREIRRVLGESISDYNLQFLADFITQPGTLTPITRFGCESHGLSLLHRATFEQQTEMICSAAQQTEKTRFTVPSECILVGKVSGCGTGSVQMRCDPASDDILSSKYDRETKMQRGHMIVPTYNDIEVDNQDIEEDVKTPVPFPEQQTVSSKQTGPKQPERMPCFPSFCRTTEITL